ncbi:MAG: sugar ABC transporter permease, partial [Gammaproteobacteria bacterium]|nr:sugar ABC transporter permease [Gammaproteobacteria bacterium]
IIAYAALTSLPREIFEAAAIDGASGIQAFLRITLPLITPALLVGLVFRIIFALRTFGIVWILTKGGPGNDTEILALYLYKQSFRFYHFGRGAAVSMFMVIITFILAFGIIKEMYRRIF